MNTAHPPALSGGLRSEWRRDYDRLRRHGLRAVDAHGCVRTPAHPVEYHDGPGGSITLVLEDVPGASGFVATATIEPSDDPGPLELGEFTDRAADTVPVWIAGRYTHFRPAYTVVQRRTDLARLGYACGPAHTLALHQVREDARLHSDLQAHHIGVEVRKAGVLLGQAGVETWLRDDEDHRTAMASVIGDNGLLTEALTEARRALPPLIAALSA